jgi:ABC-2 type transport system ATP-binding protein
MILRILRQLSQEQRTSVFITSHNLSAIEEISDRVAIVKAGRLVGLDKIEALRERIENKNRATIYLAKGYCPQKVHDAVPAAEYCERNSSVVIEIDPNNGTLDKVLLKLLQSGLSIKSIERAGSALSDIYVALTAEPQNQRTNEDIVDSRKA